MILDVNRKVMSAEQREILQPSGEQGPAWQAAAASGFDMSLVELSLGLERWDRLLEHDDALAFATRLRDAVEPSHA
jgi:hypothetical protein